MSQRLPFYKEYLQAFVKQANGPLEVFVCTPKKPAASDAQEEAPDSSVQGNLAKRFATAISAHIGRLLRATAQSGTRPQDISPRRPMAVLLPQKAPRAPEVQITQIARPDVHPAVVFSESIRALRSQQQTASAQHEQASRQLVAFALSNGVFEPDVLDARQSAGLLDAVEMEAPLPAQATRLMEQTSLDLEETTTSSMYFLGFAREVAAQIYKHMLAPVQAEFDSPEESRIEQHFGMAQLASGIAGKGGFGLDPIFVRGADSNFQAAFEDSMALLLHAKFLGRTQAIAAGMEMLAAKEEAGDFGPRSHLVRNRCSQTAICALINDLHGGRLVGKDSLDQLSDYSLSLAAMNVGGWLTQVPEGATKAVGLLPVSAAVANAYSDALEDLAKHRLLRRQQVLHWEWEPQDDVQPAQRFKDALVASQHAVFGPDVEGAFMSEALYNETTRALAQEKASGALARDLSQLTQPDPALAEGNAAPSKGSRRSFRP